MNSVVGSSLDDTISTTERGVKRGGIRRKLGKQEDGQGGSWN